MRVCEVCGVGWDFDGMCACLPDDVDNVVDLAAYRAGRVAS